MSGFLGHLLCPGDRAPQRLKLPKPFRLATAYHFCYENVFMTPNESSTISARWSEEICTLTRKILQNEIKTSVDSAVGKVCLFVFSFFCFLINRDITILPLNCHEVKTQGGIKVVECTLSSFRVVVEILRCLQWDLEMTSMGVERKSDIFYLFCVVPTL